jgi:hypothetical protein
LAIGVRTVAKGAWVVDWRTWFKVESRLIVVEAKDGTGKRFKE